MKRSLLFPAFMLALFSVQVSSSIAQTTKKPTPTPVKKVPVKPATPAKPAVDPDITEGNALLSKSDCLACHKVDVKLIGPAYLDVAKKYPATEENYELLSGKILKGGSGVWGPIPMSPHPTVAAADARKMVKYILSLK